MGNRSVFTKETLGHNLQFPEGNAKNALKTKDWKQTGMSTHLSAEVGGVSSCNAHFLELSLQNQA